MKEWTREQQAIIDAEAKSGLFVAASAGAGKTSVMIERIARLIESGVPAGAFLVVTFTNESARDMKAKLRSRLGQRFEAEIAGMAVGTFHGFCGDLAETYFSLIGLNPAFAIMAEANGLALKNQVMDKLIDALAARCPLSVDAFCSVYGSSGLKSVVFSIVDFLETLADPAAWLENFALISYEGDLDKNPAVKEIADYFARAGEYFCGQFAAGENTKCEAECAAWARRLVSAARSATPYAALHQIALTFTRLPQMATDHPAWAAKNALNDLLKEIRAKYELPESVMKKNQETDRALVSELCFWAREFMEAYAVAKAERNFLDFYDLEKCALKILSDPETLARVREKYKFIFVDEYQDTNPVQEEILARVAGGREIFTVGDVKQSIYAFRGTDSTIFLRRMNDEGQAAKKVLLNHNFRSNKKILDYVNGIFSRVMRPFTAGLDYFSTSMLVPCKGAEGGQVAVTLVEGGKPIHEAVIIADEIARLKSDGVAFNDIAILARNSTHFSELVQVLSDAGIPVVTEKKQLAGELFEIAVLNNVLVACAGAEDEIQLAIALLKQSFVFDFSAEDLANEKLGKTDAKLSNKIQGFNDFLARFRALAAEKNCADILGAFLAEFDVIDKLLITPGGEARVKNIYAFLNKLRRADYGSTARQYSYLLQNQMLDDLGIDASCGGTGGGAVRVMTIHGAKGLEFPNVFLFNAGGGWSSADKRKGVAIDCNLGLCVNSTDIDENIKKSSLARLGSGLAFDRKRIAEEMRLLYVALTRAKNRLFIVGSVSEKQRKAPRRAFTDFEILSAKNYLDFIQPETDVIKAADIVLTREKGVTRVLTARPAPERTAALAARFNHTYAHTAASTAPQKASVTSLSAAEQEYSETRPIRSFFEKDRGTEYGTKFHEAMQRQEPFDDATRRAKLIVDEFLSGMQVLRELVLFENIEKEGQRILVQGVIDVLAVQKNSPGGDALPRNASQSGGARTHARAVLIDYKTTRAPEKRLRELYLPQLSLYADAVARSLGLAPEIYIYSTHHEKLIQL